MKLVVFEIVLLCFLGLLYEMILVSAGKQMVQGDEIAAFAFGFCCKKSFLFLATATTVIIVPLLLQGGYKNG